MPRRPAPPLPAWLPTLALVGAGLLACGGPADHAGDSRGPTPVVVTDADGRTVSLPGPARRIVSLVPSATLTLGALGAGDHMVARTDFDTAAWAVPLPSVGSGLYPSIEAIVAARPDLVIRFGGPQDTKTPARLDDLGIPQIAIRPDRVEDVLHIVTLLGSVTGRDATADSIVDALRDELDDVRRSVADLPPVRAAYILGGAPPWVAGPGTYIDELITLGGGVNVFADLGTKYASVSPEELVSRHVDVVLTPRANALDRRLLPNAKVLEVSAALELPGPAVGDAAREVARLLHQGASPGGGT